MGYSQPIPNSAADLVRYQGPPFSWKTAVYPVLPALWPPRMGIYCGKYISYRPQVQSDLTPSLTISTMNIELKYLFPIFIGIILLSHGLWRTVTSYRRLRGYPGPFIASLTDFWLLQSFWRNQPWRDTSRGLHKKYGPIVRYGPNRLTFSSPSSIPVILATTNVFEKVRSSRSTL
jgi:hypothetical protein